MSEQKGEVVDALTRRQVDALERIAVALEKIARPVELVRPRALADVVMLAATVSLSVDSNGAISVIGSDGEPYSPREVASPQGADAD